jgi:hypothetical protein
VILARPGALRAAAAACLALWCISLWLPAVAVAGGPSLEGFDMLRRGWRALGSGVPSWLANPVFVLACVTALLGRLRAAGVLAGVSCLLALTAFAAPDLAERGGRGVPAVTWQAGFYLWLWAQLLFLIFTWAAIATHVLSAVRNKFPQSGSFRD